MTFSGLFWPKKASLGSLRDYHTYLCQILLTEFSSLSFVLCKEFNVCTNIFISKPMYPYVTINCRFALCRIQTSIHTQGRRTKFGHGGKNYLTFRARGASENFSTGPLRFCFRKLKQNSMDTGRWQMLSLVK